MNKWRLIITSTISIVLVSILLIGSTYSIFTTTEVDEELNVYKTGNLDITYTLSESNIKFTNSTPMTEEEADGVTPYRITVTNNGNVPYMFDVILSDTTSSSNNTIDYQYIMTKVGYLTSKKLSNCPNNIIKEDIILPAGESVDIDVRVWLSDNLSNSEIGKSFYAKLSIDGLAVYNDNTDIDNSILSLRYMMPLFPYNIDELDEYEISESELGIGSLGIQNIYFVDYIDVSNAVSEDYILDLSLNQDYSVVGWIEINSNEGVDFYIGSKYKIYAEDMRWFFANGVENIDFSNLDTSLTKNMAYVFYNCESLTELDVSNFDTSKVTDMSYMFSNCQSLTELDVSNFDTSNVTDMSYMFYGCYQLESLVVSNFDTSKVTNMSDMFSRCYHLESLDLSNFNTSNITDMNAMFYQCENLTTEITIMNSSVSSYGVMFTYAATAEGAQITVNYTSDTSTLVDNMIATKSSDSNVVKGSLVS